MLDGYRDVAKVFPCMHAWLSWKATRHARATVLCWCREKGKRGVTSPHRSSRRIRFVACASPCRARRLGYVAAGLAGAPRRDPCVAPSTTLICCWWCLVVVRTCASTHCSRAVCYCATLLVGACCFFSFFCWCCIYYHQNAWISSPTTSRSFRCVWLGLGTTTMSSDLTSRPSNFDEWLVFHRKMILF